MAAATYDKKPAFLVRELDKILREPGRHVNAAKVAKEIPTVRVTSEGRVTVVNAPSRRRATGHR
jgi:hypothetical protein